MHTTYCLIYAFAGFRTKRIELTFLKCYNVKSLLTRDEASRNPSHEQRSLIKLQRRVEGYVLALENIVAAEEYNGRDHEKLITLTVEELVAYAILSGINTINHANKPVFQLLTNQPSARPSCVSHFLPNIIRDRRWTVLDNLATDLFHGKVCCERYTITDEVELARLARILLEDWHETAPLNGFSPAPRKLAIYPVYRKKCLVWRIAPPTEAYHPGPPKIPARAAPAAAGASATPSRARDDRSREVEAEGRRSASAPSSDRTTSQPRRSQVFSCFRNPRPHAATQETEHRDPDRHRSRSDHERATRSQDSSHRCREDHSDRKDPTFKSPGRSSSSTGRDHSKTSTRSSSGRSRDSARDSSSESTGDPSRKSRVPRSNKPTERSSRKPEPRPKSSKRKSPDPEPKGLPEQEDELEYDVDLPDYVTRLLTGESEPPETPAPKRRKSDSETPPPEDPTIRVSAEIHAEAEMSDVSAEPPPADDVFPKETVETPTSSADQPSEDQAQKPNQGAEETVTPVPELSPRAEETVTPVAEPPAPAQEPTAAASESNEPAAEEVTEVPFVPSAKWTKLPKASPASTGAIPKKVTTSQTKKQKSKDKRAPTAYEALLSQPPPRIPMELGYLDLDDELLVENPRIGDTTDAEIFVQKQMDLIISAKRDHKPSKMLVEELSKTITLSDDAEGYAHVMANHLLAFIDAVDRLHFYTRDLYAVPKLVALFPNIYEFLRKPPELPLPKTDYELARYKVIGVARMLQHCGSRANPKSPSSEIHEVCYAFICRLKTHYPDISVRHVHADAEDPQIDKYMDAKTKSEREQSYRHQWKPTIRHDEPTPEPERKGFGSKPPWAKKETTSTAKPPTPPPVPPVTSELPPRNETKSEAHLRGLGRGTARAYPTSSNRPTMPHPKGTNPGPQPDDFSKGIPDIGVAFINTKPKPSKTHPSLVYGEQDIQRVTRPYAMPRMHSSVMWEPDGNLTIDDLKRERPYHHDDLLKRLCYDAEISCRLMANSDVPIWYHEVQYLEHPHHPLLNQKVPPIFLTRFLQHSLRLPKLLYDADAPFIAPLIPWEFSRDAFLPRRKHPDYKLVDEYDKAWASVRAITHHLQLVYQNTNVPRKQKETDEDYEYRCRCIETNRGFSYMPSLLAQAYIESCQPAGFLFDATLLRPFTDSYGVYVRPYMPICTVTGSERQLRHVEDCFVTDSVCHPVAFSGREWGAPLSNEIIDLRRNPRKPSITIFRDIRGFARGDALVVKEPPRRYADIDDQEVWYYDGQETYLERLPGDGNFEKPWRPYPYGLDRSPASCLEVHLTWRATFHNPNKTTLGSRIDDAGLSWHTQHKGVSYKENQRTKATQYDFSLAATLAGPRCRPNVDYELAIHRAIFCDKDESPSRQPNYTSTSYRWCDPVIWREQSRFHLTESQEDQPAQGASAASGKPDAEPSTSTAETLPATLSELNLSKSPETTERATSPMDTAEAGETPLSQPINIPELDPSAVRAECPVDPTLRGPYPTAAKAKRREPAAAQPQHRAGEYVPPATKQDNVNFVSRSTRLNTEFTAETVAGALRNIRDRQEFLAKEYYDQHYQPGNPQHDSPPVPDEKLRQWRQELEDLKCKTRPFLTATDALRQPQIALQGSNGIVRGHTLESIQGTINLKDAITGQRHSIICTDPITILEPRPLMTEVEVEPPPPLMLFATGQREVASKKQTLIETRCGDPDAKDTFFEVWSGRPLETEVLVVREPQGEEEEEMEEQD